MPYQLGHILQSSSVSLTSANISQGFFSKGKTSRTINQSMRPVPDTLINSLCHTTLMSLTPLRKRHLITLEEKVNAGTQHFLLLHIFFCTISKQIKS